MSRIKKQNKAKLRTKGDCSNSPAPSESRKPAEKPVSLRPLEFEEAVRDLLKVKPEKRPGREQR